MAISPFPAGLRAHRDAAGEIEEDGRDEDEEQGFVAHASEKAQGVLTVAALYERRIIFAARNRRS